MCEINDVQIIGEFWDANGDPSNIRVDARATGCDRLEFRVFRNQGDTVPIFSAGDRPVSAGGLANAQFAATDASKVHCGEVLWVEVSCQTDPTNCFSQGEVRVVCKGLEGAETCPLQGPPLSIQPSVDTSADCIAGGTYTVTIGGSWPSGTTFNWSVGSIPPGITSPTTEHGTSFVLQHPAGSPDRILIAEVEVPGCPDVQSVAFFPHADAADCPTQIAIAVIGPTGMVPVPADGMTYSGLPPGDYVIRVTSPVGNVSYEWYRDNTLQPYTPATPNELAIASLTNGTETTIAVRVQQECCNALLDSIVIRIAGSPGGGPTDPTDPTEPTEPVDPGPVPPVVTPPSWPCLILGLLVALGMIAALVAIVASATGPLFVFAFPVLVTAVVVILVAGVLLLLICSPGLCRILQIVCWSLKWAIVLGALIAFTSFSLPAFLVVLVYGMIVAGVLWLIALNGCTEPELISIP